MNEFRFANPEFLFLLLVLPALSLVLRRISKGAHNKLLKFMAEANLQQLLHSKGSLRDKGKSIAFWLGIAFLILAFARPQANPTMEEVLSSGLDIYVLLDVSRSMDVEDIAPSRLKKAKKTIQHLTAKLSGDRVGIIAYANSAVLITPLTSDYSIIDSYLKNIDSSIIPSQGTNVSGALEVAKLAMERGAKTVGSEESRSNIFVVMSDGEDYGESDLSIVDEIRKQGGVVFTIAFGTEKGAPIALRDERGELRGYKTDLAKNPVVSAMKPKVLQEVAARGGGAFYFSTLGESEVEDLLARVSDAQRGSYATIKTVVYEEWYPLFLAPALLLSLVSFVPFLTLGKGRKFYFRIPSFLRTGKKNLSSFFVATITLAISFQAQAHPLSFLWTKEKRASEESSNLASQKKYSEAVDALKGLQAENPDSPELNYNIGTYLLQEQKHTQAREQLSRLRSAEDHIRGPALFNTGGSFALENKKEEARGSYAELIQLLSRKEKLSEKERKLLEQTRRNVARLADPSQQPPLQKDKSQAQDQKQENKGSGDQKKEDKEPGQKNNTPDDKGKGEEGKGSEKDQQKQPDDKNKSGDQSKENGALPPRRGGLPFKERDNMGEEDAKQILGALKEKESNLQKKFLKDQVKGGKVKIDDAAKDW